MLSRWPAIRCVNSEITWPCLHVAGEALPTDIETALAALVRGESGESNKQSSRLSIPAVDSQRHGRGGEDPAMMPAAVKPAVPNGPAADIRQPDGAPEQPAEHSDASPADGQHSHAADNGNTPTVSAVAAAALLGTAVALPERANVLVTDLLDHRCRTSLPTTGTCSGCAATALLVKQDSAHL